MKYVNIFHYIMNAEGYTRCSIDVPYGLYTYRQETNLRFWVNETEFVACIILTQKNNYKDKDRLMSIITGPCYCLHEVSCIKSASWKTTDFLLGKYYKSLIHRKVIKEAEAEVPTAVTMNSTVYWYVPLCTQNELHTFQRILLPTWRWKKWVPLKYH